MVRLSHSLITSSAWLLTKGTASLSFDGASVADTSWLSVIVQCAANALWPVEEWWRMRAGGGIRVGWTVLDTRVSLPDIDWEIDSCWWMRRSVYQPVVVTTSVFTDALTQSLPQMTYHSQYHTLFMSICMCSRILAIVKSWCLYKLLNHFTMYIHTEHPLYTLFPWLLYDPWLSINYIPQSLAQPTLQTSVLLDRNVIGQTCVMLPSNHKNTTTSYIVNPQTRLHYMINNSAITNHN